MLRWMALAVVMIGCASAPSPVGRTQRGRRVVAPAASPTAYRHYLQARLAMEQGEPEDAVAHLREAILSDPRSAYLRLRLAEALAFAGDLDRAEAEVRMALQLESELGAAHRLLAELRWRARDATEALQSLHEALRLDDEDFPSRFLRGEILEATGDLAGAQASYEAILEKEPTSARAKALLEAVRARRLGAR